MFRVNNRVFRRNVSEVGKTELFNAVEREKHGCTVLNTSA
jgi:hypothetical protein